MRLKAPDNRVYVGAGGSGKSYLARRHLFQFPRTIIISPRDERENARGAIVIYDRASLAYELERLAVAGVKKFRICFRPAGDPIAAFELLNRAAMIAGDVAVLWDEGGWYIRGGRLPIDASDIWNGGRHVGCRVFTTSIRSAQLSRDVTGNATEVFIFRAADDEDAKRAGNLIGRSRIPELLALPRRTYFRWSLDGVSGPHHSE
jgi:hypothetical protein